MMIEEIKHKNSWDNFFEANGSISFLHSWEWGELESKLGYSILRIGMFEADALQAIALIIKIKSKRGNFLFVPHGPIYKQGLAQDKIVQITQKITEYLVALAKKENFSFVRIAPVLEKTPENEALFKNIGYRQAIIYMHSETVWLLPIDKSEDDLLKEMRKTTRYSIKKASKDGAIVEKRTDLPAVDDFYTNYQETVKREGFVPFSKNYVRQEFSIFNQTGNAQFFFCKYQNQILASALIIFTKSTAFYHQGASVHSRIPAAYLLQWEAIREAKKRGCQFYNFWGIYQAGRTPKTWPGLTLFKTGFGGKQVDYVWTQDYVISPTYYLITSPLEYLLKLKRKV